MVEITGIHTELELIRDSLLRTYSDIQTGAIRDISSGVTVANPILTHERIDTRHSLSVTGFIHGPAEDMLKHTVLRIAQIEPTCRFVPDGFRHITFGEVQFSELGRRKVGITGEVYRKYYEAIRIGVPTSSEPVKLSLVHIMPTIDNEQKSVSLVAAFLPQNLRFDEVRRSIGLATEAASLPVKGRLGKINVLFVTLGRLVHPPIMDDEKIPLLDVIRDINNEGALGLVATISEIDLISTRQGVYPWPDQHVYLPPISLVHNNVPVGPRYLKPRVRQLFSNHL